MFLKSGRQNLRNRPKSNRSRECALTTTETIRGRGQRSPEGIFVCPDTTPKVGQKKAAARPRSAGKERFLSKGGTTSDFRKGCGSSPASWDPFPLFSRTCVILFRVLVLTYCLVTFGLFMFWKIVFFARKVLGFWRVKNLRKMVFHLWMAPYRILTFCMDHDFFDETPSSSKKKFHVVHGRTLADSSAPDTSVRIRTETSAPPACSMLIGATRTNQHRPAVGCKQSSGKTCNGWRHFLILFLSSLY